MGLFLNDIKSHFKLDLFDKIIISIVFIIGVILCPFYCFASDSEVVEILTSSGVMIPNVGVGNDGIFEESSYITGYFSISPGYTYTITNNGSNAKNVAFSNSAPEVGLPFYNLQRVSPSSSITIDGNLYNYVYCDVYSGGSITVSRTAYSGQEGFIGSLLNNLNTDSFWNIFVFAIPYISVVVLCCIGLLFIRRLAMYLSKGKSRI